MAKTTESAARRMLRTREAARYLGLASSTIEKMRGTGQGPRFIRMGRAIAYDVRDLDLWLDGQRDQTDRCHHPEPAPTR